jgi:putative nucleotidyltransferase with HDIG domain
VDAKKLGQKLQEVILARIAAGTLQVPTLPRVAHVVRTQLDDPDVDLRAVSAALEKDPVLAMQVLRVASSPLYRSRDEIASLSQAITRLGIKKLREVLVAACARQVFNSRRPELREAIAALWNHSMAVAILARDILSIAGMKAPDTAFLGGLLHDIGKPIAAAYLAEVETGLSGREARTWIDGEAFLGIVNDIHRPIGFAVAEEWQLPEAVAVAIRDSGDYDSSERGSPTNAVRFANAVAKQHGYAAGAFDEKQIATQVMVGRSLLGIEEGVAEELAGKINLGEEGGDR